jgi:hypothetical protein
MRDREYWDSECVDNFEKYSKTLTADETRELCEIRRRIFGKETPDDEIPDLYRQAVQILHKVHCRENPSKKYIFREPAEDELLEAGAGFYGVSEEI